MVGGARDRIAAHIMQSLVSGSSLVKRQRKSSIMSVKNKYCASCAAGSSCGKHHCYKNWDESSSAMEREAILEGFQQSERVHGLRYTSFVGDGDSSVYPTLLQEVPNYARAIRSVRTMPVSVT